MFAPEDIKIVRTAEYDVYQDGLGNTFKIVSRGADAISEAIIKIAKGRGGPLSQVQTEGDWEVVEKVTDLYAHFFPEEWSEFLEGQKIALDARKNRFGLLADIEAGSVSAKTSVRGNLASIREVARWPVRWELLLKSIYGSQRFDKKFLDKFLKRLPQFATVEKKDL